MKFMAFRSRIRLSRLACLVLSMQLYGCATKTESTANEQLSFDQQLIPSSTPVEILVPELPHQHSITVQPLKKKYLNLPLAAPKFDSLDSHLLKYRTWFLAAQQELQKGNIRIVEEYLIKLAHYPLAPYLKRDLLIYKLKLRDNPIQIEYEVEHFLHQRQTEVASRKLRTAWLDYLYVHNRTNKFFQYYQPGLNLKQRCRFLEHKLQSTTEPLSQEHSDLKYAIETIWLSAHSIPRYCDPVIKRWKQRGGLHESLIWRRMLLASRAGNFQLVRYLNQLRRIGFQKSGDLLVDIQRKPRLLNQMPFQIDRDPYKRDIANNVLNKLAWLAPNQAIKAWKKFDQELMMTKRQTSRLKRTIGLSLALNTAPESKDWLKTSFSSSQLMQGELVDTSVDQWLLSNAINSKDWPLILRISSERSDLIKDRDKWQYWQSVAAFSIKDHKASHSLLSTLAKKRSYYGFLAATQLNQRPSLNLKKENINASTIVDLALANEAINAKELFTLERRTDARREWNQFMSKLPKSDYIIAAYLAHDWGWEHQSILAFAKSKIIDDVEKRFPLPSHQEYKNATQQYNVPLSWAYAVTRQESAFKPDATSTAGAQGLMQLTPATARHVARQKLKASNVAGLTYQQIKQQRLLHDPSLNIKLGVAHLKQMLSYYRGNPILATAAYNAGARRVDQWLKDNKISNSKIWIEQIPYKETREYVKNVLTYQEIYSQLAQTNDGFLANLDNIVIPTNIKSRPLTNAR
ncbi:MAG: lytic transglycosylase domain-containing protein [Kangiellaceae bacterium]|nr:lytic transglycosylase domain-containing protein [Kangiellaceae bacterium]